MRKNNRDVFVLIDDFIKIYPQYRRVAALSDKFVIWCLRKRDAAKGVNEGQVCFKTRCLNYVVRLGELRTQVIKVSPIRRPYLFYLSESFLLPRLRVRFTTQKAALEFLLERVLWAPRPDDISSRMMASRVNALSERSMSAIEAAP